MMNQFWEPVQLSIEVTIVSGTIVILIGTLSGWLLAYRSFKGKVVLETLMMLPLVLPPSVVGFILIVAFGKHSVLGRAIEWLFGQPIIFTWWAAVIASVVVAFPLMYQSAKSGFQSVSRDIEGAARVDGAGEVKVLLFISVPLAFKSIMAGSILSVARALGEFGATLMFAGNIPGKTQTVPTAIYVAIDSGNTTMAWLWVASIILLSFIMLLTVQKKLR